MTPSIDLINTVFANLLQPVDVGDIIDQRERRTNITHLVFIGGLGGFSVFTSATAHGITVVNDYTPINLDLNRR